MKTMSVKQKLLQFQGREKFIEDDANLYPGVFDQKAQGKLNEFINLAIDEIIDKISKQDAIPEIVVNVIKEVLMSASDMGLDTEDRERICWCLNEIGKITETEAIGEILNEWLYGF
jgi:hypothetical protein